MCGRFTHLYTWRQLHRLLSLGGIQAAEPAPELFTPSFNVAPTDSVPVVRLDDAGNGYVSALRWGLIPCWAKDIAVGSRMINARSEEAASKPAYREATKKRRCLVPASGFYEWEVIAGSKTKQPWYFTPVDTELFAFAGLWERWDMDKANPLETFTVLTGAPNERVAPIHNRMPCIVRPENYATWLDPKRQGMEEVAAALETFPAEEMEARRVSTRVNTPKNNDDSLITSLSLP